MQFRSPFFKKNSKKYELSALECIHFKKALIKITSFLSLTNERTMVSTHFFDNPRYFRARLNSLLNENSQFKNILIEFGLAAAFQSEVVVDNKKEKTNLTLNEQETAAILAFTKAERLLLSFKIFSILTQETKNNNAYFDFKEKILQHPSFNNLRLNIWFDDVNKRIYLGHSQQHLAVVLKNIFPRSDYSHWYEGGKFSNLTVKSSYQLEYDLLLSQSQPKKEEPSWKELDIPSGLSLSELADHILTPQGLTIGEGHEATSSKKFLIETIGTVKKKVKVLFLEHLIVEDHQVLLDEYFVTKKMPTELENYLEQLDTDNYLYKYETPYTFTNLVKTLIEADIRVMAFDTRISYSMTNDQLRMQMMNFLAVNRLNDARHLGYITDNDSFIFFVGSFHMYYFGNAPGICDYTKTVGILIVPLIKDLIDDDHLYLNVKNLFDSGLKSEMVLFLNEKKNKIPQKIEVEKKEVLSEQEKERRYQPGQI